MTRETRRLRRGNQENKEIHLDENKACIKDVLVQEHNSETVEESAQCATPLRQLSLNTPSTPVLFPRMLDLFGCITVEGQVSEPAVPRGDADNIKVVVRARPSSSDETGQREAVNVHDNQTLGFTSSGEETHFSFDYAADGKVSQLQFFRVVGRPIVENCLNGYNSSVLAYGQTGSGKTFTMLGQIPTRAEEMPEQAGLIPRMFQYLFDRIKQLESIKREGREVCFLCKVSCLEIYQEVITDLLCPERTRLQLREDLRQGIYVDDLSEEVVNDGEDVVRLLRQGTANRHTGGTRTNALSSRSHCVFTCVVESQTVEDGVTSIRTSRLHLVDLAGSERQKVAESEGERLKEASSINRSLSTLGLVINKLAGAHRQPAHVPYRDSRLTFLLQDSLGGNAKTVIIANVSPGAGCARETQSTLGFAQRAKQIVNKARVNEDTRGEAALLTRENERLRRELQLLSDTYQALRQARPSSAKGRQEGEGGPAGVEEAVAACEEEWSGRLNSALALNQDLEARVAELQHQGSRMRRDRDALDAALSGNRVQMELLVEANMDASQRAQRAEAALEAAQGAVAAASEEVLSVRAEMVGMRTRLAPTGATGAVIVALCSPERAAEASRRWDEMLAQKEALDAQVKDLSLQLANGDSVISELHSTIAFTEREKERVVEEASQMQREVVGLQAELAAACKDKAELALECDNLRTAVQQHKDDPDRAEVQTACSLLQAQLNSLQAEVASKEAAIAEYKARIVQDAEAMRRSERQLTAGAEATSALEAKVASLAEALEKARAKSGSEAQLRTKLQHELQNAKGALEEVRKRRTAEAEQILSLEAQVAYKSKSLIAAKADHAAAEQARQRLVQRDNEISARIAEMQEDMAAHLAQVQSLRGEGARLREEKEAAAAQAHGHVRALQDELACNQSFCQQLQAQHSEAIAALRAEAKNKAAALQQQLAEASSERDFFMARGGEAACAAAQAAQERDATQERLAEAQETVKALQKAQGDRDAALSDLEAKLDSAVREQDSLRAQAAALKQQMVASAGASEAESTSLAAAMASLERRLYRQRSESDARISQLQAEAAAAARQLEEASVQCKAHSAHLATAKSDMDAAAALLERLRSEAAEAGGKHEEATAQCKALSARLAIAEADKDAAMALLERQRGEAGAAAAELQGRLAETCRQAAVLEAKYRDAKERLAASAAAHEVESSSLGAAMASLEKRLTEEERQGAEMAQLSADASARLQDAERKLAEAEEHADAATAAAEAQAALSAEEIASLEERLAAKCAEVDARTAELAAEKAKVEARLAEARALHDAAVQQQEGKLRAGLLAAQKQAEEAAAALEMAQQQRAAAEECLRESQANASRMKEEVAALQERCDSVKAEREEAEVRNSKAEKICTDGLAALATSQSEAGALRQDATELQQKLDSAEAKVNELRVKEQNLAAAAAAEVTKGKEAHAELEMQASAAQERVAEVTAMLHDLRAQHAEARCDLGTKTAALQESMEQLKLSTAHATALENDLAKLRGELADTAQSLEEERHASQTLRDELSARRSSRVAEEAGPHKDSPSGRTSGAVDQQTASESLALSEARIAALEMQMKDLQERLQQRALEADAQASTITNLRSGLEDKAVEVTRLETLVRTLQHDKEQALRAVEAERVAGREARARRGVDAGELDRVLSQQRHSAERDKAAALAGLKQLYAAELALRDGAVRDLRAQRDSVMASVRQRDAALQVIDLQKSRAVEARDSAEEQLRAAARERDNSVQQLAELRAAHEAALEAASWKASELEDKVDQQRGVIEELQQHIGHLEHLLEIEAASRKKALSTHKEALAALEAERSSALKTLKELRVRQGKGLLTRLVTEQRFTLAMPQKPSSALQVPEVKRYEKMMSP